MNYDKWVTRSWLAVLFAMGALIYLIVVYFTDTSECRAKEYAEIRKWYDDEPDMRFLVGAVFRDGRVTYGEYQDLKRFHESKPVRDEKAALKARLNEE